MHVSRRMLPRVGALLALVALALAAAGCADPSWLRQQGIRAYQTGDLPRAERRFDKALEGNPGDWRSQYYLGLVRLRQSRPLDAQIALEKALALKPTHESSTPEIVDALAEALYQQNQPAELSAMLRKAADDYGTVRDYIRQGKYLAQIGDVDGARLAFRKAARFAPKDDPRPYLLLSDYLRSVGDTEGAIRNLQHAYYVRPNDPAIAERFRRLGIVPGPTQAVPPPQD